MESKLINRRDVKFVLYEFLKLEPLRQHPKFADHTQETFDAALDLSHKIAAEHFATHNRKADEHEPTFDGKTVTMIPEVKQAMKVFVDAGLMAAGKSYELGGMQLPSVISHACFGMFHAANVSSAGYPFLTIANANVIEAFGSPAQKYTFLKPLVEGRFFGTMALTEPHAGSSLSDIRTTAIAQSDGSYKISGNKMYISAGDHELSENIVHLVLAKIKGAPAGVKGISLFIVPKFLVHDDGSLGPRNDVALAGLLHKMGYRGTTSTVLNFGEQGGATGYLVGEPHKGLSYMFQMMNEARIGVGLGATMLGYTGYLHALDFARNRPQGRHPSAKDPTLPQVPIIQHTDVKRMLLAQKTYVEGAYALCLLACSLVDAQDVAGNSEAKRDAGWLLDILTPIVKSWPSQYCLEANSLAIQVHGGSGYVRDYPVEQFFRDNRLNMIHEGTHGIQSLDLLGRKATMHDGAALKLLAQEINATAKQAQLCASAKLQQCGEALRLAIDDVIETTQTLYKAGDIEVTLANSMIYMEMFGHTVMAWIWLRQALVASAALPGATDADQHFYLGKLQACEFFFRWELPKTRAQHALLRSLDKTCLEMRDEWF